MINARLFSVRCPGGLRAVGEENGKIWLDFALYATIVVICFNYCRLWRAQHFESDLCGYLLSLFQVLETSQLDVDKYRDKRLLVFDEKKHGNMAKHVEKVDKVIPVPLSKSWSFQQERHGTELFQIRDSDFIAHLAVKMMIEPSHDKFSCWYFRFCTEWPACRLTATLPR